MEKSRKKKVLIVVLIVICVSVACIFIAWINTSKPQIHRYVSLYIGYIDKEEATALYVFKVFGGKPEGIEIKECIAESEDGIRVPIQYTFKNLTKPDGVSSGDVLLIHNITNYPNWKLVVYLSGKIDGQEIEPAYAESKIPSISKEARNEKSG